MANNVSNVTVGKPRVGGSIFRAPLGTTLPTSASSELSSEYKCLGYISEDGVTRTHSYSSDTIKAWGGDTVATIKTDSTDELKATFIEAYNVDVLKMIYGEDNVEEATDGSLSIKLNSKDGVAGVYILDTITTDGRLSRVVYPNAKVSEVGDLAYSDEELVGFETTITAMADDEGNAGYEYTSAKTSSETTDTTDGE